MKVSIAEGTERIGRPLMANLLAIGHSCELLLDTSTEAQELSVAEQGD